MIDTIEITTKDFTFSYIDIKYDVNVSIGAELIRETELCSIKHKFVKLINKYKLIQKRRTLEQTVGGIIARFVFNNFSNKIITKAKDGIFHYIDSNVGSVIDDIMYVFKNPDKKQVIRLVQELDLITCFKQAIKKIQTSVIVPHVDIYIKKIGKFYRISSSKNHKFSIPVNVYNRLLKRFKEYTLMRPHKNDFNDLLFILLLRYNNLDSGGNQWGMPYTVREKFRKTSKFNFECFASSLNHYYDHYCSAFYDIERFFMSMGPFQNITYTRGVFMANPPYEIDLLNRLVKTINKALESKENITFMYGLPTWDDKTGDDLYFIKHSKASKFYKYHEVFKSYSVLWHDFITTNSKRIPSSQRYILSNYNFDVSLAIKVIDYWKSL
jgi:hypothetical protein